MFSWCLCVYPQGGAALAIVFSEDTQLPVDVEFYLVFEGSSQRHVTTAHCIDRNKLSACIPGEDHYTWHINVDVHQCKVMACKVYW